MYFLRYPIWQKLYLAKPFGRRIYLKVKPKKYPALIFEIYGPSKTSFLNYIRSVALSYNGKSWSFSASGDIQPFEDIQSYNNKMPKRAFHI